MGNSKQDTPAQHAWHKHKGDRSLPAGGNSSDGVREGTQQLIQDGAIPFAFDAVDRVVEMLWHPESLPVTIRTVSNTPRV